MGATESGASSRALDFGHVQNKHVGCSRLALAGPHWANTATLANARADQSAGTPGAALPLNLLGRRSVTEPLAKCDMSRLAHAQEVH
jgi:hypothetical protein